MVVKSKYTIVAEPAMGESGRSIDLASGTPFESQVMRLNAKVDMNDILFFFELWNGEFFRVTFVSVELKRELIRISENNFWYYSWVSSCGEYLEGG